MVPLASGQAIGMLQEQHPNAIRFTGNLCTGVVYVTASVACLYLALIR